MRSLVCNFFPLTVSQYQRAKHQAKEYVYRPLLLVLHVLSVHPLLSWRHYA